MLHVVCYYSSTSSQKIILSVIDPKLEKAAENFNWDGITFPVELKQIDKFEKQNPTISVNVLL